MLFSVSAMKTSPLPSTQTALGVLSVASVAGPSLPRSSSAPVVLWLVTHSFLPAISVAVPVRVLEPGLLGVQVDGAEIFPTWLS
jgi:hypothetical protein